MHFCGKKYHQYTVHSAEAWWRDGQPSGTLTMSYYEVTVEKGIRNDVGPERFDDGDMIYGRNVDLDESGKIQRRLGTAVVQAGAAHSAWSKNEKATEGFFVQGGSLKRILPDGSVSTVASIAGGRVAYVNINERTYWTDGLTSGIVNQGVNQSFGIVPPDAVTPQSGLGNLPAGTYLCTMTFVDEVGVESGAPVSSSITLGADSALAFSGLPVSSNPRIVARNLYVSAPNGDMPMLTAILDNTATAVTISELPEQSVPVRTQFMGPPPAGQILGYHNGRCYVGRGPFLFYSQPFEYELFDLRSGFIAFSTDVQTFAAVRDGIYVGTIDKTVFLNGLNPEEFGQIPIAPYGTILGTEKEVRPDALNAQFGATDKVVLWMSRWGVVAGMNGGTTKNLTVDRYIPPDAKNGGALLKWRDGTPQFVVSLFK
jgi:hypothetical protein